MMELDPLTVRWAATQRTAPAPPIDHCPDVTCLCLRNTVNTARGSKAPDLLKNGPLQIGIARSFSTGGCLLLPAPFPAAEQIKCNRPLSVIPPTCIHCLIEEVHNPSGSSCGPIFTSGTWAIEGLARPDLLAQQLRMARWSSSCAWTKRQNRSSCSVRGPSAPHVASWWRPHRILPPRKRLWSSWLLHSGVTTSSSRGLAPV